MRTSAILYAILFLTTLSANAESFKIETQSDWKSSIASSEGIAIEDGLAAPTGKSGALKTKIQKFDTKRSAASLTVTQSPIWQNWNPIGNLGPSNLQDAPVLLTLGPDNYWIFGRYGSGQPRSRRGEQPKPLPAFDPKPAKLEGFDMPLQTTRFPNQYDAPGGLKPGKGGYHAWQSRDMKNWVHHGPVTEQFSRWVTSAEQIGGKTLIYYDFPNDQDPHVYVDEDLFDGEPGKNMGIAVRDPSHGSDAGFIRDLEGNMHVIIEDWSPINARNSIPPIPLGSREAAIAFETGKEEATANVAEKIADLAKTKKVSNKSDPHGPHLTPESNRDH